MALLQIISIIVFSLLISKRIEAQCPSGTNSGFVYLCQPPSTTIGECSPYQIGTNYIHILLQCNVRRLNPSDSFDIIWFRERNGQIENLGPGNYHVQIQGPDDWLSRYHDTKLWVQPYRPGLLGKYWCQVIKTSVTPHQPLLRSNAFTLEPPSSYSKPTCSYADKIQTVKNATCANLPDPSYSSTVRVPVPSTTPVPSLTPVTSNTPVPSSTPQQRQVSTTLILPVQRTSTTISSSPSTAPPAPEEVVEAVKASEVVGASVGTILFVGAIITVVAVAAIVLTTLMMKKRAKASNVMFDHKLQQPSHDHSTLQ